MTGVRFADDPREEAAPPDVQHGDRRLIRVGAGERDRQAIGGHRQDREARLVSPKPVGVLAAGTRDSFQAAAKSIKKRAAGASA